MSMKLNIGIFETDTPMQSIVDKHGDYFNLFSQLLKKASLELDCGLAVDTVRFDCVNDVDVYPVDISSFSAFLITGSKQSAYDTAEWIQRLKKFIKDNYVKCKFIGICFGHQIICEALGGRVQKNPRGWEVGWHQIPFNEHGQRLFGRFDMRQFQMHQDEVTEIPEGFVNLASTHVCLNQASLLPGHVLTIQSHPEFNSDIVTKIVQVRTESGVFSRQQHDQWLSVVNQETDGVWFAVEILKFILKN